MPETQKPDLKNQYFAEAMNVLLPIPATLKTLDGKIAEFDKAYYSLREMGDAHTETIADELRSTKKQRETVQGIFDSTIADLKTQFTNDTQTRRDAAERRAQESTAISEDFRLLDLPVVLEKHELQKLVDRNAFNPLFTRAAVQYAQKHQLPRLDTTTPIDRATKRINDTLSTVEHYLKDESLSALLPNHPALIESWDTDLNASWSEITDAAPM